jgi:hypothetical protein
MTADAVVVLLIAALGSLIAAGIPFLVVESRWRWRWQEVEIGRLPVEAGQGVYRSGLATVPDQLRQAPALVRVAAFTCFLFGQMFVPGLLLGLFGLLFVGIGMVSIPGLIAASRLYAAGLALLRRDPKIAWFKAQRAVAWALWLNGVVFAVSVLIELSPLRATRLESGLGLLLFVNGYGLASVLQALLLKRAVERHEDALFAPSRAVQVSGAWYEVSRPAA